MIRWDGFEGAEIGIGSRCGQNDLIVYDYDSMVLILVNMDGMNADDASEYIDYNIVGAWVGENTPIILRKGNSEYIDEYFSDRVKI